MAWFICFAPLENPEIAVAVTTEGDTPGENYAGATFAAPVADIILKKYFERKAAGLSGPTIGEVMVPASSVSVDYSNSILKCEKRIYVEKGNNLDIYFPITGEPLSKRRLSTTGYVARMRTVWFSGQRPIIP